MANSKNGVQKSADVLETPRRTGYRHGMSATGLIGRKLARVYDVAEDVPSDMGALLHRLDVNGSRSR